MLILGHLQQRFIDATGDIGGSFFSIDRVNTLLNEGVLNFRSIVEDKWARTEIGPEMDVGVYDMPDDALMLIRVAHDKQTLEARSILSILAEDAKWETRTSVKPSSWTTDGVGHNEFRVWPTPSVDGTVVRFQADDDVTPLDPDLGVIISIAKSPGSDDTATFSGPDNTPTDTEILGVMATVDTEWTILGDSGVAVTYEAGDVLTVWYVEKPPTMVNAGDPVPLRLPYQVAPVYYALSKTYQEEGNHYNPLLSELYAAKYGEVVERAKQRAENPVPRMIHKLGASPRGDSVHRPYLGDQVTISGTPVTIHFPKRVRFQ